MQTTKNDKAKKTQKMAVQAPEDLAGFVKDAQSYLLQALTNGDCGRSLDYCPLRVLREIQDIRLLSELIQDLSDKVARRMLKMHFTCSAGLRDR